MNSSGQGLRMQYMGDPTNRSFKERDKVEIIRKGSGNDGNGKAK
jgi:hypothetical protein